MLQSVMILASVGLGILLVWEIWRRFAWARLVMKAIVQHGVVAFVICTGVMLLTMPFFPGLDGLVPLMAYLFFMPVVVFISILSGMKQIHEADKGSGTPEVTVGHMMMHNNTPTDGYYDAF